jgi:hypothetical protein
MNNLPEKHVRTDTFYGQVEAGAYRWQVWNKPRGCTLVGITVIGSGGSGGGGLSGVSGAARGGGSGGGSGAWCNALFPTSFIPDKLHLLVGLGGASPAADTIGNAGGQSVISLRPNASVIAAETFVLINGGGAGQKGTTAAATAGAGGTVNTIAGWCFLGGLSLSWYQLAGTAGAAGGTGAGTGGAGGSAGAAGPSPFTGGAGGGGVGTTDTTANDGGYTGTNWMIPKIVAGVGHSTGNGGNGVFIPNPLLAVGGSGGGCNGDAAVNSGIAGAGGNGAYGCGGGGGGGGITGGAGGKGGDGIIIIFSW